MHRFSEGLRDAYRALDLVGYEEESGSLIHLPPDECFSNIGVGYMLSGDHISALTYFEQALARNPANKTADHYASWIHRQKKAHAELAQAL
jgi:tetratricopeptide (TPR) repeat protein